MRTLLTTLFLGLAVTMLTAQAGVLEKRIDFTCKNKSLKEALDKLKRKTGLRLSYADKTLGNKRITIKARGRKTGKILSDILRRNALTYELRANQIVIRPAPRLSTQIPKHLLTGVIMDASSNKTLPAVTIHVPQRKRQFLSSRDGHFDLELHACDTLIISLLYIGYATQTLTFPFRQDTSIHIKLIPANETLSEVVVLGSPDEPDEQKEREAVVTTEQIDLLRSLKNEKDIIKSIQLLPGVQSGNEGFAGLYVRGGSIDQNLVLLDDVPVYNATHLLGIFSIFNEQTLSDISLHKNSIPANYGGRLSSVLNVTTRDGNMKQLSARGTIGLLTSGLLLEGPIKENKTSFLLSVRRTWLDMLIQPLSKRWLSDSFTINDTQLATNGQVSYYFYDLNAKVTHIFSDKDRLSVSLYNGGDKFDFTDKFDRKENSDLFQSQNILSLLWGNLTASARWSHVFQKGVSINTTVSFTDFQFDFFNQYDYLESTKDSLIAGRRTILNYASDIRDLNLKSDLSYEINSNNMLDFGMQATQHSFAPGINSLEEENIDTLEQLNPRFENPRLSAWEFGIYTQSQHTIGRFSLNAGIRAGVFAVDKKLFSTFEPRLSTSIQLTKHYALRGAYTKTSQFLHLLSTSNLGLPNDLWIPSLDGIPPEKSWQTSFGMMWSNKNYAFSIDTYYRQMDNLVALNNGDSLLIRENYWKEQTVSGKGRAYGVETTLVKQTGKTTGIIGYTLAWSDRQFGDINKGEVYPYKYGRRHDLSIALQHQLSKKIALKTDWAYGNGTRYSTPTIIPGYPRPVYDAKNNAEMSPFHRLNIGIMINGKKAEKYTWKLDVGVYNIYNRKNPFFTYPAQSNTADSEMVYKELSLFPIMPNINYSFKF